ncbi:MAG: hypothetical protein NT023_01380, partial [Armatimonadetes bacterium]|nr:hypothetical protein [Armatimonadota bacterium]
MRFLTLLAAILGFGYQVKPYPRYLDIGPGWLQGTRLTYFMPYEYDSIGRELQDGNTKKAAPIFEQASRKFPENLAFYLCYIQSYPKAWDTEQKRLASLLATEPNNLTNKAQLGAILYSQWFVSEEAQTGGKKGLKKAIALVEPFWEQSHDPACGVLLVEMHLRGGYTPQEASKIKDELIHRLGGERVYASYLQAKRKKFFG